MCTKYVLMESITEIIVAKTLLYYLEGHTANNEHLFPCVRVVGRIIESLGPPQLFLCQSFTPLTTPEHAEQQATLKKHVYGHSVCVCV